ncbi:glycoside hydrolase family 78 protein [Microbacterium kitamiense]|uniref:alpha-L-rhamnosidase n=1 Tax=Microbacterium aurantiacum TaxID=162393 RepID=A0AAJ2HIC2_9MICO|nr:glycoside hydrolase family 78 protein [Microbacterium aurantiacum]
MERARRECALVSARVAALRAEYRRDSPFVAVAEPRLSWIVDAADQPGWEQGAAEIRLDGKATAQLQGSDHAFVAWPFPPLMPRCVHRVEVRVSDTVGEWSDWSAPHEVRLGALAPGEWRAQFIGLAAPERPAQPALLRRTIEVGAPVAHATLYATALGALSVSIDGRDIDDTVLSPGWTTYGERILHDAVDVTALLTAGAHEIRIALTGAWYTEEYGFGGEGTRIYGEQPAAALQLHVHYADGSEEIIVTDAGWEASAGGEVTASGIYAGETIDHRRRPDAWAPAAVVAHDVVPEMRAAEPVRRVDEIAVQQVLRSPSGAVLLDFGQNLVGRLRVRVAGPEGTEVVLRHAEVLEDGELGIRPLRRAAATDRLILAGGGADEVFEPSGTFHGFRYAQVDGWPGEVDPAAITAVVLRTDMVRTAWFDSSHALLNRLHENVVWSMSGNFLSIPTDCPQRDERMGWTGDAQVFAPTAATLFDCDAMLGSWLRDLEIAQNALGGVVPFTVPDALRFPVGPTAAWGDAATIVPSVLADRFGDRAVIAGQYDSMRAWTDRLIAAAGPEGVWQGDSQLGDWLDPSAPPDQPGASKVDAAIVATAYLFRSAQLTARAARELGLIDDETRYAAAAERTREGFLRTFVTAAGRMMSDAPTAYALALTFGIVDEPALRTALGDRLAEVTRREAFHIATGFVGTPLILDALTDAGHLDAAARLLLQEESPSWLHPVTMGATTVWERWDSMLEDGSINPGEMTSFNHYALGAVVDWFYRRLVGVASTEPGYRRIRFAPVFLPGIDHASARIDTVAGTVAAGWRRTDAGIEVSLEVPAHSRAELDVPGLQGEDIGSGQHTWVVANAGAPASGPEGGWNLGTPVRVVADSAAAYRAVIDTLRDADPELAARIRSRTDWTLRSPLAAVLFDVPGPVMGQIAGALARLGSGGR